MEEKENVMLILQYLAMYQDTLEDEEKESDEMSAIVSYAGQGFGQITQQTQGTYGSLLNQNNSSYGTLNMNNQRNTYGQQYNDPYRQYQYPYQQQTGIYSSIKNTVTNSMFLKR